MNCELFRSFKGSSRVDFKGSFFCIWLEDHAFIESQLIIGSLLSIPCCSYETNPLIQFLVLISLLPLSWGYVVCFGESFEFMYEETKLKFNFLCLLSYNLFLTYVCVEPELSSLLITSEHKVCISKILYVTVLKTLNGFT